METIEGFITESWEKPTKTGKMMYFLKLDDDVYSAFGSLPEGIKEMQEKSQKVRIRFEEKGGYKNLEDVTKIGETDKEFQEQLSAKNTPRDVPNELLGGNLILLSNCFDSMKVILGHKPETDGELMLVASLFKSVIGKMSAYAIVKQAKK